MAQRNTSRKPRNSGASRRGAKKGGGVPGWVWLVTGVLVGLFAAFLVFLVRFDLPTTAPAADRGKSGKETVAQKEPPKSRTSKETQATSGSSGKSSPPSTKAAAESGKEKVAQASKPSSSTPKSDGQKDKPTVNYDFYKILPQYEVVVPEEDPRKPTTSTTNSPGTYYLQVGAFRQMPEADSRKAELAMLGIVSSIQTVTIDPGNTWHRVRIGPVKDMRQLDRTKRQLQENNISFVTLKEKS